MSEYPRRRGKVVQTAGPDGWTIYESETDSLHVLNASAKAIWDLCDGLTNSSEMAEAISELTGVAIPQVRRDVDATLDRLAELALVAD